MTLFRFNWSLYFCVLAIDYLQNGKQRTCEFFIVDIVIQQELWKQVRKGKQEKQKCVSQFYIYRDTLFKLLTI